MTNKKKTIYFSRNGLMEPLGESQVLPYLKHLSQSYRVTLVTFEKPSDLLNHQKLLSYQALCLEHDIDWVIKKFSYTPKFFRPIIDIFKFTAIGLREVKSGAELVHCRSYIPSFAGLIIFIISRTPFIFDMRALWPDELASSGRISSISLTYKLLIFLEKALLKYAASVVSLTHAAAEYLDQRNPEFNLLDRMEVIPTCVDLDKFQISSSSKSSEFTVGCIGTVVSGWFKLDFLSEYFLYLSINLPNAKFEIVSRDNQDEILSFFKNQGFDISRLKIFSVDSADMPHTLWSHSVSTMFFNPGIGKLGSSPTRLGEILACGIPVIANDGIGDVSTIIKKYNVGIIINSEASYPFEGSIKLLEDLFLDNNLAQRCRLASEEIFSLNMGSNQFAQIYKSIISEKT